MLKTEGRCRSSDQPLAHRSSTRAVHFCPVQTFREARTLRRLRETWRERCPFPPHPSPLVTSSRPATEPRSIAQCRRKTRLQLDGSDVLDRLSDVETLPPMILASFHSAEASEGKCRKHSDDAELRSSPSSRRNERATIVGAAISPCCAIVGRAVHGAMPCCAARWPSQQFRRVSSQFQRSKTIRTDGGGSTTDAMDAETASRTEMARLWALAKILSVLVLRDAYWLTSTRTLGTAHTVSARFGRASAMAPKALYVTSRGREPLGA